MRDERISRRRRMVSLELVTALKRLGGTGHFDTVVQVLQAHRLRLGRHVSADMVVMLQDALVYFEHSSDTLENLRPALFFRKFGQESRRWSLLPDAAPARVTSAVLEEVENILAEMDAKPGRATDYEAARRKLLAALGDGERGSAVDILILDELESRARTAAMSVLQ